MVPLAAVEAEASKVVGEPAAAVASVSAACGAWSGVMAIATGSESEVPTANVVATVFVAVSMTLTVPTPELVTKTWVPSGVAAMPAAPGPTVMVFVTELVAVEITLTVPSPSLVTYNVEPSGVRARPSGASPTVIVAASVSVAVEMTVTVESPKFAT